MTQKDKLVKAIFKAREDLINFRHILLVNSSDEVECAPYHKAWSDLLLNGKQHEAIEGYRESAKTQYIMRSFLLYALMFPSEERDYIVIIKNNATLARNVLREIEEEARSNPVIDANRKRTLEESGDVYSVDRVAEDGKIINIRIEAYGKGASVRGLANRDRRPKICIIDDPQDLEDAKSEAVLKTDWDWFLSDIYFLGQHTRIFLISNNLGERSIVERIFASADRLRFHTMKVKAIENGQPSWPAKYTIEEIERDKAAFRELGKLDVWLREKMCEATSEETRVFDHHDYQYYTASSARKIAQGCNLFATLDPASSPDITSCYRAIVVNAVDEANNWFIMDVPFGRWDSMELMDRIFKAVTDWRLREFGIEKGIFKQVIEPFIYEEMRKRNIFFKITPLEHAKAGSKLERIKMLQPRFKSHSIFFPHESPWLVEMEAELAGVTKDAVKSLYIDLVDCLAMQEQIAKPPYFGKRSDHSQQALPREAETEEVHAY